MRLAFRVALLGAVMTALCAPEVAADQGKSGDSTDWGCGGHPATAASSRSGFKGTKTWFFNDQANWHDWWYLNRPLILAELSYRVAGPDGPAKGPEKWRDEIREELRKQLESPAVAVASEAALSLGRGGDPRDTEVLMKIA